MNEQKKEKDITVLLKLFFFFYRIIIIVIVFFVGTKLPPPPCFCCKRNVKHLRNVRKKEGRRLEMFPCPPHFSWGAGFILIVGAGLCCGPWEMEKRDRVTPEPQPNLPHKSRLSFNCLFSVSLLWILGACVIMFQSKDKAALSKSRSFPQLFFPNLSLESPASSWQARDPGWPACAREGPWAGCVLREGGLCKPLPVTVHVQGHGSCAGSWFC